MRASDFWPESARSLRAALSAGAFDKAYALAESLLDADPRSTYRIFRDMWADGVEYAVEKAPPSPWTLFLDACRTWRAWDNLRTIALLAEAADAGARYAWMRYYAAEVLLRHLDLYALAAGQAEAALAGSPWLWEARCLRAEIGWALGETAPLRAARATEAPDHVRSPLLTWLGALSLWSGDHAAARELLAEAVSGGRLGQPSPDAHCWLGAALLLGGDPQAAVEALGRTLARDPRDAEALTWRAEARRALGRPAEALADAEAALAVSDDWFWARAVRARVLLEEKREADGLADFAALNRRHDALERLPSAAEARALLERLFPLARGCRRAESHLNVGWQRAAGVATPPVPPRQPRLMFWLRHEGLARFSDADFAEGAAEAERGARAALARRASGGERESPILDR